MNSLAILQVNVGGMQEQNFFIWLLLLALEGRNLSQLKLGGEVGWKYLPEFKLRRVRHNFCPRRYDFNKLLLTFNGSRDCGHFFTPLGYTKFVAVFTGVNLNRDLIFLVCVRSGEKLKCFKTTKKFVNSMQIAAKSREKLPAFPWKSPLFLAPAVNDFMQSISWAQLPGLTNSFDFYSNLATPLNDIPFPSE